MTLDELKLLVGAEKFLSDDEICEMDLQVENGSAFRMTDCSEFAQKAWPLSNVEIDQMIQREYINHAK